jgi:2,4-dienoyl-CoA reductase-like NADH-dependent reductase (Old Yellow Enzyme family)
VAALEKIGVDAIEVSGGMWDCLARDESELGWYPLPIPEARTRIGTAEKQSYFRKYLEQLNTKIPIILIGGNKNVESLEEIAKSGLVDFFSMSRPFICEPDLPNRWLEGRGKDRADCISCNTCIISMREGVIYCMFKKDKEKQKETQKLLNETWRAVFK